MKKITYNSAYGDAKFSKLDPAKEYFYSCKRGGVAVCMFATYYMVTTNRRASKFEKQGDCIVLSHTQLNNKA